MRRYQVFFDSGASIVVTADSPEQVRIKAMAEPCECEVCKRQPSGPFRPGDNPNDFITKIVDSEEP